MSASRPASLHAAIRRARPAELPAVLGLLAAAALPADGVAAGFDRFVVAERAGAIVGAAGIELHGGDALLRSVVVADTARGGGIGAALVEAALRAARAAGARRVYLLTTTADGWFPRHGFERIERSAVPAAVRESVEFTSACPASAVVMVRQA